MEALTFLFYPFLGCVLLILIHAYFGIHILERGIIFVDLAMAQFIALGIAVAFLLGHEGNVAQPLRGPFRDPRGLHPLGGEEHQEKRQHGGVHRRALHLFAGGEHADPRPDPSRPGGVQDHPQWKHPVGDAIGYS